METAIAKVHSSECNGDRVLCPILRLDSPFSVCSSVLQSAAAQRLHRRQGHPTLHEKAGSTAAAHPLPRLQAEGGPHQVRLQAVPLHLEGGLPEGEGSQGMGS